MIVFAIAAFGCTLPHFIFGDKLLHANNAFYGVDTPTSISTSLNISSDSNLLNLCRIPNLNDTGTDNGKTIYP